MALNVSETGEGTHRELRYAPVSTRTNPGKAKERKKQEKIDISKQKQQAINQVITRIMKSTQKSNVHVDLLLHCKL